MKSEMASIVKESPETSGLQALYQRYRNFILYVFIGGFCASLDFGLFELLDNAGWFNYQVSNFISTHAGIFCSFLLNSRFNFKVEDKIGNRFVKFYIVGLLGWALSAGALYVMIDLNEWPNWLAKGLSLFLVVAFQFTCNKLITFAK